VSLSALVDWFESTKRDLPWRDPRCGAWGVLVSEVMLQQTPVVRVLPQFASWMARWPTPTDLAQDSVAEAVKAWDRLGYPRRAKRLHEAALTITRDHGGEVPIDLDALLALPGIGDYTARAIRTFAFGIPEAIVDTNIRRVVARVVLGDAVAGPARTTLDRTRVSDLLAPMTEPKDACVAAAALMELGAVLCTPKNPACAACPMAPSCQWKTAGFPEYEGPLPTKQATYQGSDRQIRGIILRELRHSDTPVRADFLATLWPDKTQFFKTLRSLESDGLIRESSRESHAYELPH
jgi:A/G-specific adenine glycosylase